MEALSPGPSRDFLVCLASTLWISLICVSAQNSTTTPNSAAIYPSFSTNLESVSPSSSVVALPSLSGTANSYSSVSVKSRYHHVSSSSPLTESYFTSVTDSVPSPSSIDASFTTLSALESSYVTKLLVSEISSEYVLPPNLLDSVTSSPVAQTAAATTTAMSSATVSPDIPGMNLSTSTESHLRTTVAGVDNMTKSTLDNVVVASSSPVYPGFGNGSCAGNNTGCPQYNGRDPVTLPTPAIIGIAVGAAVFVIVIVCLLLCLCRRRRTLSGSKADLSAYWDDNVTLSYINGHLDFPKDTNDEMVSLDNDSFLNSLDSMSFSNMWVSDSAKHTNL